MMYRIGISCVGGGVGQSVINSCRFSNLPFYTIGLDTNPLAFGAYECDTYDYISPVYDENYISDLIDKCKKHDIDLIIPGLDDEILMYARNTDRFREAGIQTIVSGENLIKLCRDKEKMSLELNRLVDVFVKSYDKDALRNDLGRGGIPFPLIAKPRGGSASNGISLIRNEDELHKIGDDHIIQELAMPSRDDPNYDHCIRQIEKNINPQVSEISVQLVTDKNGKLLGRMASYNKLKDGIPIEIVPIEDNRIWSVIDQLMPHFLDLGLRGPLNVQGRLTEEGLKIFEMNPRFTGITGLRALMGFNEVESCIASWLEIERADLSLNFNHNRFGIRQTADKSIPIERNEKVGELSRKISTRSGRKKKTLLVTGASGNLGHHFVSSMLENDRYDIWILRHNKDKQTRLIKSDDDIRYFDQADLDSGQLSVGNIDILLNLGIAGPHQSDGEIADRLAFTSKLFRIAAMHHTPAIVNISTQDVYGDGRNSIESEAISVAPPSNYAQAMYTSELMLESVAEMTPHIYATSLRLAKLTECKPEGESAEPVARFVLNAIRGENLRLNGESQMTEQLHVRDAASAILALLETPETQWKPLYEVGPDTSFNSREIAEMVLACSEKFIEQNPSRIVVEGDYTDGKPKMDRSAFSKDTGWKPSYRLEDIIDSLFRYYLSKDELRSAEYQTSTQTIK